MTEVGTGELTLRFVNKRANTSRNCSRRTPTCRMSFSFALPSSWKFFERTLVHVSLADTGACEETTRFQLQNVQTGSVTCQSVFQARPALRTSLFAKKDILVC